MHNMHLFLLMFLYGLVLFIEISFSFPEIFKKQFLWGLLFPYSHHNFVVTKFHLNCSLDHEITWTDWGIAFTFLILPGNIKMCLFPLKLKRSFRATLLSLRPAFTSASVLSLLINLIFSAVKINE